MISELAQIHPDAKIASGVVIEPFAIVQADVVIGEGTWVGSHAVICDGARIGKNCKIHPGAVISGEPQDLKFAGEITTAEIGDNTVIREYVTISRGTTDKMKTVIGSNVLLMAYVHVAHDCEIGDHCILANSTQVAGHVTIGEWAIVGGTTAIHQFVTIGRHAMIAGGAKVGKDIPPYILTSRTPCGFSSVNIIGLRRRGFSNEQIRAIQDVYKALYAEGKNISQAIEAAQDLADSEFKTEIFDFAKNAPRGVIRPVKEDYT
ncbi:acyl-[acyl-carrier-protein]--UDP-N-acetylglucosamine O-acyltransferase [Fulvitalea axinellae]|uniref:Acyl-[acyl-carrier-protein]--UDP-N-acetylglucosamine O-acyltransferase n=1 Tax=Fulvitalea axinellae TaxID=1182444 RepID=A0AAU9CI83_9BACT|nr:acyl-[acyl-carrier-protein]--UDP-N-acetylglucosamine O-acyltransferase [Fulvitalea axinellae]